MFSSAPVLVSVCSTGMSRHGERAKENEGQEERERGVVRRGSDRDLGREKQRQRNRKRGRDSDIDTEPETKSERYIARNSDTPKDPYTRQR